VRKETERVKEILADLHENEAKNLKIPPVYLEYIESLFGYVDFLN